MSNRNPLLDKEVTVTTFHLGPAAGTLRKVHLVEETGTAFARTSNGGTILGRVPAAGESQEAVVVAAVLDVAARANRRERRIRRAARKRRRGY